MRTFLLASTLLLSTQAMAQQLSFGGFAHTGTGCPQGTTTFTPSPDGQSVSVLFNEFVVQVPQYDGQNDNDQMGGRGGPRRRNDSALVFKYCGLGFDVELPQGQLVDSIEVSVFNRGATILDVGVLASYTTTFLGSQGLGGRMGGSPRILERKLWGGDRTNAPVSEEWVSSPTMNIPIRSTCAGAQDKKVRFELRSHITAEILGGDLSRSGLVTIDSSDVNGSIRLKVKTSPCGATPTPQRPDPRGGRRGSGPR